MPRWVKGPLDNAYHWVTHCKRGETKWFSVNQDGGTILQTYRNLHYNETTLNS